MADRSAPTVPGKPRPISGDAPTEPAPSSLETAGLRDAPSADPLDAAVGRARIEGALFGDAAPVLIGRYTLTERAGAGGMGVVWKAFDPELGRPVALKLAASRDAPEHIRQRARDEGRALAKLSHPNVVPIYDVLDVDEGVFLVMELVAGKTLREPAEPGDVVRAYRQCGEGLAAAHAAGLIHRDFKPENAIRGDDGRVRVLDFGLAREVREAHDIAGTPRYMAPEQRAGKPLTAAVDQYALCASLRESLDARVPRWLEPVLARGTAPAPEARYPSMRALLDALDPGSKWKWRALAVAGVVAVGAVIAAFTLGRAGREAPSCDGGEALIAASYPRERIAAHLASLTTPYAVESSGPLLTRLDAYARGWEAKHRTACQAHLGGSISSELFDRRTACLSRRRTALSTLGEVAIAAQPEQLAGVVTALGELPELAACEDDAVLVSGVEPPPRWKTGQAAMISSLIARADVERSAARFEAATRDADLALARATELGYRPLIARALLSRGRIGIDVLAPDRGAAQFAAALSEAIAAGDDPLAVEAFARQAWAVATTQGPARATDGLPMIEGLVEKLGERGTFERALLRLNLANVALARGDREVARAAFMRARSEVAVVNARSIELTAVLAGLVLVTERPARDAIADELIARRTQLIGANHPLTLGARSTIASMLEDPEAARAQLDAVCKDFARYHPALGADIAECSYESTWLAMASGDREAARAAATLVVGTEKTGGPVVEIGFARAALQFLDGKREAVAAFAELQRTEEKEATAWWHDFYIADAAVGEAVASRRPEALRKAAALYRKIEKALPAPVYARRLAVLRALQ